MDLPEHHDLITGEEFCFPATTTYYPPLYAPNGIDLTAQLYQQQTSSSCNNEAQSYMGHEVQDTSSMYYAVPNYGIRHSLHGPHPLHLCAIGDGRFVRTQEYHAETVEHTYHQPVPMPHCSARPSPADRTPASTAQSLGYTNGLFVPSGLRRTVSVTSERGVAWNQSLQQPTIASMEFQSHTSLPERGATWNQSQQEATISSMEFQSHTSLPKEQPHRPAPWKQQLSGGARTPASPPRARQPSTPMRSSDSNEAQESLTIAVADEHIGAVVGRAGRNVTEIIQVGSESYQIFVANNLTLSGGMKKALEKLCGYLTPQMPLYICQINKSDLKKMRLSAIYISYISEPFFSCLHRGACDAHCELNGQYCGTIRVTLEKDGRASLRSGWQKVVADKDIKVGDICALHLQITDANLKLSVHGLDPSIENEDAKQNSDLLKEVEGLRIELEHVREAYDNTVETQSTKIETLEIKLAAANEKLKEVEGLRIELEHVREAYDNIVETQSTKIETLEIKLETQSTKIETLEIKLAAANEKLKMSDLTVSETISEYENMKKMLESVQSRLEVAEKKNLDGEKLRKELHNTIELEGNMSEADQHQEAPV